MNCIELTEDQVVRNEKLARPNVSGHNSLFFHPITKHGTREEREEWGYELTVICEEQEIEYYCFDHKGEKINVYPNDLIEQWWTSR